MLSNQGRSGQASRCVCGHAKAAHQHYRRGTDCGVCGPRLCPGYRPPGWRGLLIAALDKGARRPRA